MLLVGLRKPINRCSTPSEKGNQLARTEANQNIGLLDPPYIFVN